LAEAFFGFESSRLDLLTLCTWAFLIGLVGDTWLEVAVRSHYANLNTRTPLIAAAIQVSCFVPLSAVLSSQFGLAGIPLAAAITFTLQALGLLVLLNRKYPGLLELGPTVLRAFGGAAAAGLAVAIVLQYSSISNPIAAILGLVTGGLAALPFIWRELRLFMRL
jgi:peptidoglycan biosynthesis protein MviN/MurJ (putative lipid II flippase)